MNLPNEASVASGQLTINIVQVKARWLHALRHNTLNLYAASLGGRHGVILLQYVVQLYSYSHLSLASLLGIPYQYSSLTELKRHFLPGNPLLHKTLHVYISMDYLEVDIS